MDFSRERLEGNWLHRRRPSRWHVAWLLPLAFALWGLGWGFADGVAETREDVRAWENRDVRAAWENSSRGCVTTPCSTAHLVVDLRVTDAARGRDNEYVTYRVEPGSAATREVPIDLGVTARRRIDWEKPVVLLLRDDTALGVVDASGVGWASFRGRPQAVGFEGQVAVWFVLMGVLCLAWVPQQWRHHRADFTTPGLPQLRLATTSLVLSFCLLVVFALARAPWWLSWPGMVLAWVVGLAYAGRAWRQLWRHGRGPSSTAAPETGPGAGQGVSPPPARPS
ncbi:hypothetical protein IEQ44_10045 [Nocardioides sp. Y6]|uniref:DUF3592 domain-containing protein n=1 Tax=Nocardioides malaquae TaxID=2773426 RepID=A0ABR9RTU1_9ACTN|nr:hypothetical protein [Nocardioides malaquae]MBE7324999.1 hypothetical protein [Nocardioides malaquae]